MRVKLSSVKAPSTEVLTTDIPKHDVIFYHHSGSSDSKSIDKPEKTLVGHNISNNKAILINILLDTPYWQTKHSCGFRLPKGIKKIQRFLEQNDWVIAV